MSIRAFGKYLSFFILGATLAESVKPWFAGIAANTMRNHGWLDKIARELSRSFPEDTARKAEEFFNPGMDCDCTLTEGINVLRAMISAR